MQTPTASVFESRWQLFLVIGCLAAIAAHFLMGEAMHNLPLIAVIVTGGLPLCLKILYKLSKGSAGADLLGVIGLLAAAWLEQYLAAVLIVLMLASGQALESYAMRRASAVLQALAARMPAKAHRKIGDRIEEVDIADIQKGDLVIVPPHESSPVDGIVVEGHSTMDESYLTGEPYHISKAPGSGVLSGAINGESALVVLTEQLAKDSRYARIMAVMQEAEQQRPQLRRLGDQIGAVFAVGALVFALIVWAVTGDALRFLSVLVIATPCPLIIAIPLTIVSAISISARRGIVVRDPTVLERLPTCRTAIFDKTGTLTYGKPELVDIITRGDFNRDTVLAMTASLEAYSKHPLSGAIIRAATQDKLALREATEVSEKPGQGLTGIISGKRLTVTHRKKLAASHPALVDQLPPPQAGMECVILVDEQLAATFIFRDTPRSDGKSFIGHLSPKHQFKKIMLLSGDRASEVEYLAKLLGITETYASQSPEQKLERVRQETALAPTLFMGDGINDAPALAAATVGIAFGSASSVTTEAAGAVILENTLVKVDELLHISGRMRTIALQSAIGGIALSLIGMGFAASGHLSPVAGALMQEAIDVLAILNALRLTWQSQVESDI